MFERSGGGGGGGGGGDDDGATGDGDPQATALLAAEHQSALALLAQCDTIAQLYDSQPVHQQQDLTAAVVTGRVPEAHVSRHDHVLAEAAALLHLHPLSVGDRLGTAWFLQTHPLLRTLLSAGALGVAHLQVTVIEVSVLDDTALADTVLHDVLASGGRLGTTETPAGLRTLLRRAFARLDPDGVARRRAEQTRDRTGVKLRTRPGGLADLVATGEASRMQLVHQLLHQATRADTDTTTPGDDRTYGQRQIDTLLRALIARTGATVPLELQLNLPVTVTDSTTRHPTCPPEPITITSDLTPALLTHLLTAAGITPHPHHTPAPARRPGGRPAGRPAGRRAGAGRAAALRR